MNMILIIFLMIKTIVLIFFKMIKTIVINDCFNFKSKTIIMDYGFNIMVKNTNLVITLKQELLWQYIFGKGIILGHHFKFFAFSMFFKTKNCF